MTIVSYVLEGIPYVESPDHGGAMTPKIIVMHYTGGGSAKGSVEWLAKSDDVFVSAHIVIDREGSMVQLVPFNVIAYHAGVSTYKGVSGCNKFSIGIELANMGKMPETKGLLVFGKYKYNKSIAMKATHKNGKDKGWWEKYPEAQIDAAMKLCKELIYTFPTIKEVVGHEDIAPTRKIDPGPAFPGCFYDHAREK